MRARAAGALINDVDDAGCGLLQRQACRVHNRGSQPALDVAHLVQLVEDLSQVGVTIPGPEPTQALHPPRPDLQQSFSVDGQPDDAPAIDPEQLLSGWMPGTSGTLTVLYPR